MTKLLNNYKGLPKEMYIICFAKIINRLGDFVVPFLALYLTQKLGMSAASSGVIVTLASVIGMPAAIIGGKISDKCGRKKIYVYAQSLSALFLIPCAFTKNIFITISCLLISTFFSNFIRPAFTSMVTDILPTEKRQAGFALQYLSINIGVSIGPILAGLLFNNLLPLFFIGDAFTSLMAALLINKNIEETYSTETTVKVESTLEKEEKGNFLEMILKRPQLYMFFILNTVYGFVYTQHKFSLPLSLNSIFSNNGAKYFGYLMSINAVTVLVLTVFITALTKKNHQLTNMFIAGIMYAIGFGMIGFIHSLPLFILSTVVWTCGEILCSISSGVYVADNSPVNYRARINSLSSIVKLLGSSSSTFLSGLYINALGLNSIWKLVFFIAIIASFLMYVLKNKYVCKKYSKTNYEADREEA